jgi:capsid protein
MDELGTCGETLWRFVRGPAAGNKFNFALEPVQIDRLCITENSNLANGHTVRMGVEKDAAGRVVAYYITDSDPTDLLFNKSNAYRPRRYAASGTTPGYATAHPPTRSFTRLLENRRRWAAS